MKTHGSPARSWTSMWAPDLFLGSNFRRNFFDVPDYTLSTFLFRICQIVFHSGIGGRQNILWWMITFAGVKAKKSASHMSMCRALNFSAKVKPCKGKWLCFSVAEPDSAFFPFQAVTIESVVSCFVLQTCSISVTRAQHFDTSGLINHFSALVLVILRRSLADYPVDAILGSNGQLPRVSSGTCDLQYRFNILIRIFN